MSIVAPAIGTPPGPVNRPASVRARPKPVVTLALRVPLQRTDRVACADAFVPFAAPGAGALATVTLLSSTGAALPAASITLTTRWCAPLPTFVVSNGTSTLTDGSHGCTYSNAANPSVVCPTSLQRPPLESSTVR